MTGKERNEVLYEELMMEIERYIEKGREVLLGGDFNGTKGKIFKMRMRMKNVVMVNVMAQRTQIIPRTRSLGSRAIDRMWATPEADSRIYRIGMIPNDHVFASDHSGLYTYIVAGEHVKRIESPEHRRMGFK